MTTTTDDRRIFAQRMRKATAMMVVIRTRAIATDTLERLDDEGWRAIAGLAGVWRPSDDTKRLTIDLLRGEESALAIVTAAPFSGLMEPHEAGAA